MSAVPRAAPKTDAERLARLLAILNNRADADYDHELGRYFGNAESSVLAEYTAWLDGYATDDLGLAVVSEAPAMLESLRRAKVRGYFDHRSDDSGMEHEEKEAVLAILARIGGAA